jgi:hypothetical protein
MKLEVGSSIIKTDSHLLLLGDAERIFPEYLDHLNFALEDFCSHHWPCEFTAVGAEYPYWLQHLDGITAHRNVRYMVMKSKCINVRSGHGSKGHQARNGAIFASGDYVSTFNVESSCTEFLDAIYLRLHHLMSLLAERTASGESAEIAAQAIHRQETLIPFYNEYLKWKGRAFHCHSVCLGCLFDRPEHALPCGHILCTSCVLSFGQVKGKNLVEIECCPLEDANNQSARFKPQTIFLKPDAAASRVLVLDR